MPFEINLGERLVGYALSAARKGEDVQVVYREFTSIEDGQHFIDRLESLPSLLVDGSPNPVSRSQVDNLLAILHFDESATVYLNELDLNLSARPSRQVNKGAQVLKDDIVDIEGLGLSVDIPNNAGFIFLFSVGWRKGLFYDYGPLLPDPQPRQFDVSIALGQAFTQVAFQERFAITDREWEALFDELWFPFTGLGNQTIARLLSHVRSDWKCDDMLDDIVADVRSKAPSMLKAWRNHPALSEHMEFLERGVERFLDGDAISCTFTLFPCIEGIVRTYLADQGKLRSLHQDGLAALAVSAKIDNHFSLLMPRRFKEYLQDVYFANFDLKKENVPLSRNSVGHGVVKTSDVNDKSAVLGILIVDQLHYFLLEG